MRFPVRDEDIAVYPLPVELAAAVQASRTEANNARYGGWRPKTVEEVAEFARTQDPSGIGCRPGIVQLAIESDGDFRGDMAVVTRDPVSTVELGIVLAPGAHGQGVATRACRAVLGALFASGLIRRATARVDPRNARSLALFDRLGFRREGHERECYWDAVYEEWTDEVLFGLLRGEWHS